MRDRLKLRSIKTLNLLIFLLFWCILIFWNYRLNLRLLWLLTAKHPIPNLNYFWSQDVFVFVYDFSDGLVLLEHLLMVAPTLVGISSLDYVCYHWVDAQMTSLISWQVKKSIILNQEADVPSLLDFIPVILRGLTFVLVLFSRFLRDIYLESWFFFFFLLLLKGRIVIEFHPCRVFDIHEDIHLFPCWNKNYKLWIDVLT